MAVQFPNIYRLDISKGQPIIKQLPHMGQNDKYANRIGVELYNGSTPVTPGGSCIGEAVLSNGATVPMENGVVSGNMAYVDLLPACYAVPGPIRITVKWTDGTTEATLFQGFGNVSLTETGTVIDPGTIIPSVTALIAAIDEAVESIPQDYSVLSDNVEALTHCDLSITGKYIDSTGAVLENAEYACSDFIPVNADSILTLKGFWTGSSTGSAYAYYFYNASKAAISGGGDIRTDTTVDTIPSGAAYVRFSSRISQGETPVAYVSNHVVQDVAGLLPRMDTAEGDIADLKSAIGDVEDFVYSEYGYNASGNVDVSTGTLNKTAISDIVIPSGSQFSVKVTDTNSIIPNGKLTLYYKNSSNSNVSLGAINTGETKSYTAEAEIRGFVVYKTNIVTSGSITVDVNWTVANAKPNLDARVKTLEDGKNANSILTYSEQFTFSALDFEVGSIDNDTGELNDTVTSRMRSKDYIKAYKGLVVNSAIDCNVFEYDLATGEYLYSTTGWKKTYTVTQDCGIKILVNSTTVASIISGLSTGTPIITLSEAILPIENLSKTILSGCPKYFPSVTMKSIAHRGRYGKTIGMECGASAVIAAKKYGFSICENDVALTSDGKFVMWHDSTLSKAGDADHSVGDYTLAELKEMDFGSYYGFPGEKILTFKEWILLCKKVGVDCYIDFKVTGDAFTSALAQELVNIVKTAGMLDHVSYLNNQNKVRQYHPNARLVMLVPPTNERISSFQQYLANGPVVFDPNANVVTEEICELALLNGYEMECYYVGFDPTDKEDVFDEIDRLAGCGVQAITLDYYRVEDAFNDKYGLLD